MKKNTTGKNEIVYLVDDSLGLDDELSHAPFDIPIEERNSYNNFVSQSTNGLLISIQPLLFDLSDEFGDTFKSIPFLSCQFVNAGSCYVLCLKSDSFIDLDLFVKRLNNKTCSNFKIADNCPPVSLIKNTLDKTFKEQSSLISNNLFFNFSN